MYCLKVTLAKQCRMEDKEGRCTRLQNLPPGSFAVFSLTIHIRTPLQRSHTLPGEGFLLTVPWGILVVLGLGSSKTFWGKSGRFPTAIGAVFRFLDFAERGTLVAVRVTLLSTHGKNLATACDTDVIDDETCLRLQCSIGTNAWFRWIRCPYHLNNLF